MSFRDNAYRSLMTGTMAPKHHTNGWRRWTIAGELFGRCRWTLSPYLGEPWCWAMRQLPSATSTQVMR